MLKLLLQHFSIGALAAVVFGGLMLWTDMAGIASLLADEPAGLWAIVLLFAGLVSTFGPVAMLFAFMESGEEEPSGRPGDRPPRR